MASLVPMCREFRRMPNTHFWGRETILLLLDAYEVHKEKFSTSEIPKKNVWKQIAEHINQKGYSIDGTTCDKKFRNLTGTYRRVLENNSATGSGRRKWEYFDKLHDLLGRTATSLPASALRPILESNHAASAHGESTNNTSAVSNLSGNMSLTSDIDASSADNDNFDQEEASAVSGQAISNRTLLKRKRPRNTPEWAREMMTNMREQHALNQHWRERMEGLMKQSIEEQQKRTEAIVNLTTVLSDMRK